jgi:Zn-dependent protease
MMGSETIYMGIVKFSVLLFSLVFHEFGHAWTALRCGDPTAKLLGRVTLSPFAHADPIGTVLFPLLQIFTGVMLIGWAKPVPFNPAHLRNVKRDSMLISIAGPGFNLILAIAAAVLWRVNDTFLSAQSPGILATLHEFLRTLLPMILQINVLLALFNLIPMPPLDGSWIVYHLLPPRLAEGYRAFGARWGFLVVLALVYTGVARTFIGFGFTMLSPMFLALAGR